MRENPLSRAEGIFYVPPAGKIGGKSCFRLPIFPRLWYNVKNMQIRPKSRREVWTMELGEKTLASELIFDGVLLKLYRDEVELTGGC